MMFNRAFKMTGRQAAAVLLLCPLTLAHAQRPADASHPADPLDARAPVPHAVYQSPLTGYRGMGSQTPTPWIEANETVNRIGGWRAYARQAQQPETTPGGSAGTVSAPDVPAARGAHSGH
ncbi:MAG: multi-Cu oxidase [Pseudomonadota bacterium]|jgi:hypothetical protein